MTLGSYLAALLAVLTLCCEAFPGPNWSQHIAIILLALAVTLLALKTDPKSDR